MRAALLLAACAALCSASFHLDPHTKRFIDVYGRERYFHGLNVVYKSWPYLPMFPQFDPQVRRPCAAVRSVRACPCNVLYLQLSFAEKDMAYFQSWGLNIIRLGVCPHVPVPPRCCGWCLTGACPALSWLSLRRHDVAWCGARPSPVQRSVHRSGARRVSLNLALQWVLPAHVAPPAGQADRGDRCKVQHHHAVGRAPGLPRAGVLRRGRTWLGCRRQQLRPLQQLPVAVWAAHGAQPADRHPQLRRLPEVRLEHVPVHVCWRCGLPAGVRQREGCVLWPLLGCHFYVSWLCHAEALLCPSLCLQTTQTACGRSSATSGR